MAKQIAKSAKAKTTNSKTSQSKVKNSSAANSDEPSANIIQVSLNKLALSPKNVRKVKTNEKDDIDLKNSIFENGLKQNLAGYEDGNGGYLIDAGGRRLQALQSLAAEGLIEQDMLITCLIESEDEAIITSTLENAHRAAMHPADQFQAFNNLIEEGRTEEEIATKFSVSVDLVRKRLKLARVAPEIFEEFRKDELNLEAMMAFTISDDHDRQLKVWNDIKDGHYRHPNHIRNMLTENKHSANSKLAKFVSVEAYQQAGGTITTDLFSERDNTYLDDAPLLERLSVEKLNSLGQKYTGDWKWVDVSENTRSPARRYTA